MIGQDYNSIIAYLEKRFNGQLFLFDKELSQILGMTTRQLVNMRYRGTFPFYIHYIGKMPAVSISELASYLSKSNQSIVSSPDEVENEKTGSKRSRKSSKQTNSKTDFGRESLAASLAHTLKD